LQTDARSLYMRAKDAIRELLAERVLRPVQK
jgi:hypothetical protein